MGDGIKGEITKGPVHLKVDAYVNHKNILGQFDKRSAFLANLIALSTWQEYLTLLTRDVGLTRDEANYLRDTWYDDSPGNSQIQWRNLQPIFPALNRGLIKAVQEAGSTRLLDSYWMPVGGPPMLAVAIAKSPVQVTRIIVTPPSRMAAVARPHAAPMWAVTKQETPPVGAGHTTSDGIVEAVDGDVLTWRRREFTASLATDDESDAEPQPDGKR